MLNGVYAECRYAECHYAECHYDECRYAECCGAQKIFADIEKRNRADFNKFITIFLLN